MTLIHCKLCTGDDIWINSSMIRAVQATVPNKECKVWLSLDDYWTVDEAAQALVWRLYKAEANNEQT